MTRKTTTRLTIGSTLALLMLAAGLIVGGVGVATYFELVQLHLDLADASARLEAVCRGRAELATNVLDAVPRLARQAPPELERVRGLVDDARELTLEPSRLASPGVLESYVAHQDQLTETLDAVVSGVPTPGAAVARNELAELRAKLDWADLQLRDSLVQLDTSIDAYDVAVQRFPGSAIAAGVRFAGRPMLPVVARASRRTNR